MLTRRVEFVEGFASVDTPPEEDLGEEDRRVTISGKGEVVSGDGDDAGR